MKEAPKQKRFRLSTEARIIRQGSGDDLLSELKGKDRYDYYDSSAEDFNEFFSEVIAPYTSIREYVEAHYGTKEKTLVGIEYGGPARKLFSEIGARGSLKRSAGFVLLDRRTDEDKIRDIAERHDVVEADVFFRKGAHGLSWNTVEEWVAQNGRPHLAIERMVQGVDLIRRADLFVPIAKRWLSQLAPQGTLIGEIPHMMPLEERRRVAILLQDDALDAEEVIFNNDLTAFLIRRS